MWLSAYLLVSLYLSCWFRLGGDTASAFYQQTDADGERIHDACRICSRRWRFRSLKPVRVWKRPFVVFKTRAATAAGSRCGRSGGDVCQRVRHHQPVVEAGTGTGALWMTGGPIFFSLLAMAIV